MVAIWHIYIEEIWQQQHKCRHQILPFEKAIAHGNKLPPDRSSLRCEPINLNDCYQERHSKSFKAKMGAKQPL